jgi:hypothetical protein
MIEQNISQLIANVDWTIQRVREVFSLDQKMIRLNEKPIKVGCFGIGLLSIGTIFLGYYLVDNFSFDEKTGILLTFAPMLAISVLIFLLNRFLIQLKKSIHEKAIKEYPTHRKKLMKALQSESIIPAAYWNTVYLELIKTYFVNKRADSVKEALNLLELDIKHNEQMQQLQSIQDSMPTTFVGFSIDN